MRRNILLVFVAQLLVTCGALAISSAAAQQGQQAQQPGGPHHPMSDCPMMQTDAMAQMNKRGDQGMGFSQEKTTHHFYLTKTGGAIQVEANDAKDALSRDQIRQHFKHIATMFAEGNFEIPMFVHDQTPPGVAEMQKLKAAIEYRYEESERGARVLISSADPQAVAAVQSFLRFQIKEHKTGDQ